MLEVMNVAKPKVFEKPIGVRDYLPHIVRRLRQIQRNVLDCMERWGYQEIMTPTLEYYETVGAASSTSESKQFKLLDPKGKTLVLRSDMTAPIARVAASLLKDERLPLRLAYHANVFRAPEEEAGRDAEFFQTGVELIGDPSTDADAEVVALAIASIKAAGLHEFKMALGHIGFIDGLFVDLLNGNAEAQQQLKEFLLKRNYVGYSQLLQRLSLSAESKFALSSVLRLRGGMEVCDQALQLTGNATAQAAIEQLRAVYHTLEAYRVADQVFIDLTMIGDFSYYTGITFEGYTMDQAFPVCNGGRYDLLLQQFGRHAAATGFSLKTNRILEWLEKQSVVDSIESDERYQVLILYDDRHRAEAIGCAADMRLKDGFMVETQWVSSTVEEHICIGNDERYRYNGRVYHDIITYVDGNEVQ